MSSCEEEFVEECSIAWVEKDIKKRTGGALCAYPTCVEKTEQSNRYTDLVWCSEHHPKITEESDGAISHNSADMVPSSVVCTLNRCTNFTKKRVSSQQLQMLFTCKKCGKVCAFCAKECHRSNHAVIGAQYEVGSCEKVEIQSIETHYVALVRGPDGKRRKIHEVTSYRDK